MDDICVLVTSCNKYKQLWSPFSILIKKYWPDCPYNIYAGTDIGLFPNINTIEIGKDLGWCNNFLYFLNYIKESRIILFQEDFLIKKYVNTDLVKELVKHSFKYDVGCLRLCPCPGPTLSWPHLNKCGIIGKNDDYRVSLQLAIWKKQLLLDLIKKDENIWAIEQNGIERTKKYNEPFLSVWRKSENEPGGPIEYFITAVTRGKWTPGALDFLKSENIIIEKGNII